MTAPPVLAAPAAPVPIATGPPSASSAPSADGAPVEVEYTVGWSTKFSEAYGQLEGGEPECTSDII